MTNRAALILGHNRPEDLREVITGIAPQVAVILVIDNASEPPLHLHFPDKSEIHPNIVFLRDSLQPANLSYLWNVGLNWIQEWFWATAVRNLDPEDVNAVIEAETWKVAVLTDDVVIPYDWFDVVEQAMDETGAAAGSTSAFPGRLTQTLLKTAPDADLVNRMYGPAFVLRGESGIRADERLKWWWNDTHLDWTARLRGGMVQLPGPYVHNKYPNASTTGERAEQAGRDREIFKEIWGWLPW